jgi:hypothetical protein
MGCPYDSLIKKVYIPHFHQHGESAIPFLVNGLLSSKVFLSVYKTLPPIEEMEKKEKDEMKKYVRDLFPNKTPEEKLNACKIIYTIGNLA